MKDMSWQPCTIYSHYVSMKMIKLKTITIDKIYIINITENCILHVTVPFSFFATRFSMTKIILTIFFQWLSFFSAIMSLNISCFTKLCHHKFNAIYIITYIQTFPYIVHYLHSTYYYRKKKIQC